MQRDLKHRLMHSHVFHGPNGETMRHEYRNGEDKVVMHSPRTGEHVLDFHASTSARIAAHWAVFTGASDDH